MKVKKISGDLILIFEDKKILITGGTGSLGKKLLRRILSNELGKPKQVIVFSRDEAKQHYLRMDYMKLKNAPDNILYNNFKKLLSFRLGDIRNYHSVCKALADVDIVFNAAALKQVPACEYFPSEAIKTNILGAENICQAIKEYKLPIDTVIGVSTDKACKPVNVMGMTKAIQERIILKGNIDSPNTRFVCVRYGNVLASRGSVLPYFKEQIKNNGPVTITHPDMTRFLLSLDKSVDTIFEAVNNAKRGDTYIPNVKSAKITDIAELLIGNRNIKVEFTGIRPGEKIHEILVSEEEVYRTIARDKYYVIKAILPEITDEEKIEQVLINEFSSANNLMTKDELKKLFDKHNLLEF